MSTLHPLLETWRAKRRASRNTLGRALASSAPRVLSMFALTIALVLGLHFLFRRAFAFINGIDVLGPVLLVRLLSLFFFTLFAMLVMSNLLVAFQTLYRSKEATFWCRAPLSPESVLAARSPEMATISSWAFLVLGTPLLLAYGLGTEAGPAFFIVLVPLLACFTALAHFLGTLLIIVIVRLMPGIDWKRLFVLLGLALIPLVGVLARAFRIAQLREDQDGSELVSQVLEALGRTQYPLLPGYWAAESLRAAAHGELSRSVFLLWCLAITALLVGALMLLAGRRWLLVSYQMLNGRSLKPVGSRRLKRRSRPASSPALALAAKDVSVFLREPGQWSQVALVSVLAITYVANLRHVPDLSRFALWGNVAAYLNLGVALLLMATLTTRFAFPLISMEGRRAWIALLAPLPRHRLVGQKLLLALPLALVFGLLAIGFSTHVLGVSGWLRLTCFVAIVSGAFALSGLAVGLGAVFPNLKEDNPARIVSGLGGTLNFLLGVAFVSLTTLCLGAPSVLTALERMSDASRQAWEPRMLVLVVLLSAVAGGLPLLLGRRRLESMNF